MALFFGSLASGEIRCTYSTQGGKDGRWRRLLCGLSEVDWSVNEYLVGHSSFPRWHSLSLARKGAMTGGPEPGEGEGVYECNLTSTFTRFLFHPVTFLPCLCAVRGPYVLCSLARPGIAFRRVPN